MLRLVLDASVLGNLETALEREWIEGNGLGGWASSTVVGANTRRDHGLLVAAIDGEADRLVLLSKLDETLVLSGRRHELAVNRYPGAVHPQGNRLLVGFERAIFPSFAWRVEEAVLRKTVVAIHGENTTVVVYDFLEGPGPITLELAPLVAGRGIHELLRGDPARHPETRFEDDIVICRPVNEGPQLELGAPGASWEPTADWFWNFEYDRERERGVDFREDLYRPGTLRWNLAPGERVSIVATADGGARRDAGELVDAEAARRVALLGRLGGGDDLAETLSLAADPFLVRRGQGAGVVAGYHGLAETGRDALISLAGLAGATRRFEDARGVLRTHSSPEPDRDGADAPLWLFVAVHRHLTASGDRTFVRDEMLPALRRIFERLDAGGYRGVQVGTDGLLEIDRSAGGATSMGDFEGRHGRPVELEALWYNALCVLSRLERSMGSQEAAQALSLRARDVRRTFLEVFWNEDRGCLHDVIRPDRPDTSIRPHQIFAVSLPFPLLSLERARRVLDVIGDELATPFGLRSLSPADPAYPSRSEGEPASPQGTVRSWLLGPYLTSLARVRGSAGRKRAAAIVEGLREHLVLAGIGSISEAFDAEPPHAPRGCIAHAAGVAEILRAWVEDVGPSAVGRIPARRRDAADRSAVSVSARRKRPYRLIDPSSARPGRPTTTG